jgi:hypothetical protein
MPNTSGGANICSKVVGSHGLQSIGFGREIKVDHFFQQLLDGGKVFLDGR